MDFYTRLAPVYDTFFPPNSATLRFLEHLGLDIEGEIYDAGCATGSLAIDLAEAGRQVVGIDLATAMIAMARGKAESRRPALGSVRFLVGDMTDPELVPGKDSGLALALCLGNTFPHLHPEAATAFLSLLHSRLNPRAPLVLQLLNYSHPEIRPGFRFPELRQGQVVFRRSYEEGGDGRLIFVTELDVSGDLEVSRTALTAFRPETLRQMLAEAGFTETAYRSGWEAAGFDMDKDRYLIVSARA